MNFINQILIIIGILDYLNLLNASSELDNESNDEFCYRKEDCENDLHLFATNELNGMKYLLYDVSKEQSNSAKRNIYINIARIVKNLGSNYTLVLPPWHQYVPRWKNENALSNKINWSDFFKIEILRELISLIEFDEFIEHISNELDLILILNRINNQNLNQIKNDKQYELINENCKHDQFYVKDEHIYGHFFGYKDYLKGKKIMCLDIYDNHSTDLLENLFKNKFKQDHTIYLQNLDLINQSNKDQTYWLFRKSIQLSDSVLNRANKFRRKYFDSDDEKDKTFISIDWQSDKLNKLNRQKQSDEPIGGNYIGVHWLIDDQKIDYKYDQSNKYDLDDKYDLNNLNDNQLSNKFKIQQIAKQILIGLKSTNNTLAFISSNIDDQNWNELNEAFKNQLNNELRLINKFKLYRYQNKSNKLSSVELELIEQSICAHARIFIGYSNSIYTQSIVEERDILGFKQSTNYAFCDQQTLCQMIY